MLNYNGTLCTTLEQLEELIVDLAEDQKQFLRNDFNGVSNEGLVANPLKVKIYDYLSNTPLGSIYEPPIRVDFVTGLDIKLHRKSTLVKGECIREDFYASAFVNPISGVVTYENLIVKEETVYTRNPLGFPVYKTSKISYALEDGTFHSTTKTITKMYSSLEQISEGKVRRGNLVDNLQLPCICLISYAIIGSFNGTPTIILEGRKFLSDYKNEFELFVSSSDKSILSCLTDPNSPRYISTTKYPWIDSMTPYHVTIRQYLTNELTI